MEEEINYSTVVFKNGRPPPKEKTEDPTIYSEVKPKGPATTVPTDGEAAAHSHFRVLAVCLGILSVLLVAGISVIVYTSVVMNRQEANLSHLKAANKQLITEKSILERETEKLSRFRDDLNWTLGVIMKFNTFPVNTYCPEKKCQPCDKGWILFHEKCYLFYNKGPPWKSWEDSRKYCQNTAADLAVIGSLQEQEFISNHIKYYYDNYHGYWVGLHETGGKNWIWVDGRNDTLRYWVREPLGRVGTCGLMIPGRNPTASWFTANCPMENKFICESEVLIRSN